MPARIAILFLIFFLNGCVESFDPGIDDYENVLVVDGMVSNEEIAAKVSLSRTFSYRESRTIPEKGASLFVIDKEGKEYSLEEKRDGYYIYNQPDLIPKLGDLFQLRIVTSDGEFFQSDYQELSGSSPLDSFYYIDFRGKSEESFTGNEGVEFYIEARGAREDNRYYKWEWEESWKILSPINYPSVRYCWQFDNSKGIHIATTESLSENILREKFIFQLPFTENKLAIEYSVLVKQYGITRDNYSYLTKLQKINEGFGGFFDPIPAALEGNISCISDPEIPVIGFFEVSAMESKRLFVKRSDLKYGFISSGFEDCESIFVSIKEYRKGDILNYYYVYQFYDSSVQDTIVVMTNDRKCHDCSYVGDPAKPSFWIN